MHEGRDAEAASGRHLPLDVVQGAHHLVRRHHSAAQWSGELAETMADVVLQVLDLGEHLVLHGCHRGTLRRVRDVEPEPHELGQLLVEGHRGDHAGEVIERAQSVLGHESGSGGVDWAGRGDTP